MKYSNWYALAALVLLLTGCEDNTEDERWDRLNDDIAGKYSVTAVGIIDNDMVFDLDGDGTAHSDIFAELKGLPNYHTYSSGTFSNVTRATISDRTGYMYFVFPVQGLAVRYGEIVPQWIAGNIGFVTFAYTVGDDYTIAAEDIPDLDMDEALKWDLSTMSDFHVSYIGAGEIRFEVTCPLYDFITGTTEMVRLQYTYRRYEKA